MWLNFLPGRHVFVAATEKLVERSSVEAQKGSLAGAAKVSIWANSNIYCLSPSGYPSNFRYQHQVLARNPVVTEANKNLLVETFRSIAEILIWGDQNDSRVFE